MTLTIGTVRLLENNSVVSWIVLFFPWYLILASFMKDLLIISLCKILKVSLCFTEKIILIYINLKLCYIPDFVSLLLTDSVSWTVIHFI